MRFSLVALSLLLSLSVSVLAQPTPLGVEEAIDRAVSTNLRTRLSREKIREAEAEVRAAYTAYNPRLNLNAQQYNRSVNLASQGLSGSDLPVPTRIGPFYTFTSNLEFVYRLYDRSRHWTVRSREIEETISELKADSERRAVTVLTSATYIQLLEAREATRVSQSDLDVAQRLMELASDQERAGIAAGVDVTRAQTRLAERELQLEQDREKVRTTQRRLLRLTGLPLTGELLLQDDLLHLPNPFPPVDEAVALAKQNRVEVKVAEEEIALAESRFDKAKTEDDPTLDFVADAGLAGNTPFSNSTFIHNVGLSLNIPLYDGGLTREQSKAAESRIEQARLEREDVEIQVEEDVREAYSLLETSERSMSTAEQSIRLAAEELEMARDRFAAGLTNNVEVLAAEAAFTRANYNRLDALGNYDLGLIRLAAASGQPELLLETFREASNTERNDQ